MERSSRTPGGIQLKSPQLTLASAEVGYHAGSEVGHSLDSDRSATLILDAH